MSAKKLIEEQFDVVVIGAGPAGMMAAIRAAQKGVRVALVDKKEEPGKKLLMAGNGRCNLTQDQDDLVELSNVYKNGRFLISALSAFRPNAVRKFFGDRGVETKIEKSGRVFPKSDKATDVLRTLAGVLKEKNVTFLYKAHVDEFIVKNGEIEKIKLRKREIFPGKVVLATGGKSYPATGSMGDGYEWAKKMGHRIIEPQPALVPINVKEDWVGELQGVSVGNVELSVYQNSRPQRLERSDGGRAKKKFSDSGDLMFAHFGLSGPLALNTSREIGKLLAKSDEKIKLAIDLKPYLSFEKLDEIVREDFEKNANKKLNNCLSDIFSPKLLDFVLRYSGLDTEKHAAKISKKERHQLVNLFKHLEMNFESLAGYEKAMVTSGGVSTKEIDSKTMQSKIVKNLYFAGEIIDVDGPTGGYNLQMCWSTGFLAGENASKKPDFEIK